MRPHSLPPPRCLRFPASVRSPFLLGLSSFPSCNYSIMLLKFRMCNMPDPWRHSTVIFFLSCLIPVAPFLCWHLTASILWDLPVSCPLKATGLSTSYGHSSGPCQISEGGGEQHSEWNIKCVRSNGSLAPQVRADSGCRALDQAFSFPWFTRGSDPCSIKCPSLKPH